MQIGLRLLTVLAVFLFHFSAAEAQTNRAPSISGTPKTSVVARQAYLFQPTARDPEGRRLTFSIRNKPGWASFSSQTGRLAGTPSDSNVGTYRDIVIGVSDGRHTVSLPAFTLRVTSRTSGDSTNRPPTVSGAPVTSARVGQAYTFTPSGSDPEGRPLTWSITNRPAWASFSSSTGRLSGTPSGSHVGTTSGIVIRASDGTNTVALPTFSITVSSSTSSGNRPPVISGTPPTTALARETYNFLPTASDPEGRPLTFSINTQPPWASFSTQTGRLAGAPGTSHVGTTYGNIVITVSDGQNPVSLPAFSITVRASGSQTSNRAPVVSGTPPTTVTVGSAYSFTPTASDPDGDSITWSISGKPAAANFSVSNGRLNWTPTAAGSWSNIVITATDSRGASSSLPAFSITATTAQQPTSGSAALSWQAPTQYTNGTSLPSSAIAAYRIYRGTNASSLNRIAEVDGRATDFNVQNLAPGTHYFAVTAVTSTGAESSFSAVGSKTIR